MFQGISQIGSILNQARQMQGKMADLQEALKKIRVQGEAGAGMVVIEMDGQAHVLKCRIDPSLGSDVEMLEDLVVAATNQASDRVKEAAAREMQKLTEGVDMSAIQSMLGKFGMGQ